MSVNIHVKNAIKKYGNHTVIEGLNLDIQEGELFTLLGPSGCGKTTLLRMIAGFNSIEGGDFYFNDKRINDMDPGKRNIGMVFQNYAIFPHMSVKENVAFGLKNRKLPANEIEERTQKFLKLMQIDQYQDRKPENLSGGQQQRVALARALVIAPDVLLMDEPLSNLDAKLRVEMRTVIQHIQKEVGITCVYVTHDQEEAMAISDRIAVMKGGVIQQIGSPKDLYQRPYNLFVATFIGHTNVLDCDLDGHQLTIDGQTYALDTIAKDYHGKVKASIRPEELEICREETGLKAKINQNVFLGLNTHYFATLCQSNAPIEIVQESSIDETVPVGTVVNLRLKKEKINLFDETGENSLMKGVRNDKQ